MSSSSEATVSSVARSFLFVPGDRPERFDKAVASGADAVILDLEDAVAPAAKARARSAVAAWLAGGRRAIVRINGADTAWYGDDLEMVRAVPSAAAMLPKADADSTAQTERVLSGCRIIALVETVAGYMSLAQLACAASALSVTRSGAQGGMPTYQQLLAFLAEQERGER